MLRIQPITSPNLGRHGGSGWKLPLCLAVSRGEKHILHAETVFRTLGDRVDFPDNREAFLTPPAPDWILKLSSSYMQSRC